VLVDEQAKLRQVQDQQRRRDERGNEDEQNVRSGYMHGRALCV
jgi:hypothetical protein